VADLAAALSISEEAVLDAQRAGVVYEPVALEDSGADDLGEAEAGYGRAEQRVLLEGLLRFLTLRQRQVVSLRFGEELTQQQIGERVGLSQMQVSRILREAVQAAGRRGRQSGPCAVSDAIAFQDLAGQSRPVAGALRGRADADDDLVAVELLEGDAGPPADRCLDRVGRAAPPRRPASRLGAGARAARPRPARAAARRPR
jgi:hypothetical protein